MSWDMDKREQMQLIWRPISVPIVGLPVAPRAWQLIEFRQDDDET